MSDDKCIVKYLRLSLEDDDMLDESNSITNQRIVIGQYIASKSEFKNAEALEFKDDGYSGTNFDRPGFQKMMELVRDGKISTIIVKDLSRFGRNHIEVDTYLEQIFPFLGVRFIAINDNVDSEHYESGMPGIDVGFRNIINEHHSIDTSVKVKKTLIQRQKAGKYMGARAPYGYLKPDEDVTSLVINPETAPIVRMIFEKFLDGMNITQVCRYLNEQGIMCPGQYKKDVLKTGVKNTTNKYIWYPTTVRLILTTKTYVGTTIGGKWKVAAVGSNKHVKTNQEDWIVVEGTHEPIISKEMFEAAQEKLELNSRKKKNVHNNNYPLKGLVICGGCGQKMTHVSRCKAHFKCPRKFNSANPDCVTENLYDKEFNEIVFRAIKLFAKISDDAEPVLEMQKAELKAIVNEATKSIRVSNDRISRYRHQKTELYMKYATEVVSEEEFSRKNDRFDRQIEQEKALIVEKEQEQNDAAEKLLELPANGRECLMKMIGDSEVLTRDIAVAFVRNIKVYHDKRIEIEWNFDDELVRYVEKTQHLCS
jgi:DNA invertase Pin-like site-specific DNA recombinase